MTPTLPPELQPLANLIATVDDLKARVEELEAGTPIPAIVRFRDFPEWYRVATGSPEPPVSKYQLNRWRSRPEHYEVDWLLEIDGRPWVDAERFIAWTQRAKRVRVKPAAQPRAPEPKRKGKRKGNQSKVGAAGRVEIVRMRRAGVEPERIAKRAGVSVGHVRALTRGVEVEGS